MLHPWLRPSASASWVMDHGVRSLASKVMPDLLSLALPCSDPEDLGIWRTKGRRIRKSEFLIGNSVVPGVGGESFLRALVSPSAL